MAIKSLGIKRNPSARAVTSAWIREHPNEHLHGEVLANVVKLRRLRVGEKAEKLFQHFARTMSVGETFPYSGNEGRRAERLLEAMQPSLREDNAERGILLDSADYAVMLKQLLPLMGVSCAESFSELHFLLIDYLVNEQRLLLNEDGSALTVSPSGWAHFESGGRVTNADSAFVAMWFSEKVTVLWKSGIRPGVVDAGYEPIRIDEQHHSNKIDDEIIAAIRRTKFVVADFTGQRGGVYFEAGFALGLGQKVIWLCEKAELEEVHFDTRQYQFIPWEDGKWEALSRALSLRIEAIFGKGSYVER